VRGRWILIFMPHLMVYATEPGVPSLHNPVLEKMDD
jgi:hypothetical protein